MKFKIGDRVYLDLFKARMHCSPGNIAPQLSYFEQCKLIIKQNGDKNDFIITRFSNFDPNVVFFSNNFKFTYGAFIDYVKKYRPKQLELFGE